MPPSVPKPPPAPLPLSRGWQHCGIHPRYRKSWRPLAALPSTATQPQVGRAGCWGSALWGPQNLAPRPRSTSCGKPTGCQQWGGAPQDPPSWGPPRRDVRSGVHEDGAHFVHAGVLQVGAGAAELMAAALEVLLLEDGNLQESGAMRAGHSPHPALPPETSLASTDREHRPSISHPCLAARWCLSQRDPCTDATPSSPGSPLGIVARPGHRPRRAHNHSGHIRAAP